MKIPRWIARRSTGLVVAVSVVLAALALLPGAPALASSKVEIVTLSNRPDKLSGGDVLVKVVVPPGTQLSDVTVHLNRRDVTGQFWQDAAAHALVGLVTGLESARTALEAKAGASADRLDLQNYPLAGPIFSGPAGAAVLLPDPSVPPVSQRAVPQPGPDRRPVHGAHARRLRVPVDR